MKYFIVSFLLVHKYANAKLGNINTHRILGKEDGKKGDEPKAFEIFEGKIQSLMSIKPTDVGKIHNACFEKLGELYSDKMPRSNFDIMQDVSNVMADFCPIGDLFCKAMMFKATLEEYSTGNSESNELNVPADFDEDIKESLQIAHNTINSLNENNSDDVVDMLSVIMNDIESMEDVNPNQKDLGVAALSVATESTKLWNEVYTNSDHPMHHLVADKIDHQRRLQGDWVTIDISGENWDGIFQLIRRSISADFVGSVTGGALFISEIPSNPVLIWPWNWPGAILFITLVHSIPASSTVVFGEPLFLNGPRE